MSADKSEVLQGTLDMMILKTLHALGPLHGFGIARRIEQVSEDVLTLNEGTVYTSLLRLQQQGWIESEWGTSENNRKARFYSITRQGRKQLAVETENWERISGVIGRVLRLEAEIAMTSWIFRLVSRVRGLFGQKEADSEFDLETQTHLQLLTEQFIRREWIQKMHGQPLAASSATRLCCASAIANRARSSLSQIFCRISATASACSGRARHSQ